MGRRLEGAGGEWVGGSGAVDNRAHLFRLWATLPFGGPTDRKAGLRRGRVPAGRRVPAGAGVGPGPRRARMERPAVLTQEPGRRSRYGAGPARFFAPHGRMVARCATISRMSTTAPTRERTEQHDDVVEPDVPWIVIVWNDPVNLMSYVVFVLQKLFGYDREKATRLMLDVHHKGKAVVSSGPREKAEFDVYRLHGHGLWATMQKDR
jgi:ATP-dependent Clp protease adaptor protein ClpS